MNCREMNVPLEDRAADLSGDVLDVDDVELGT